MMATRTFSSWYRLIPLPLNAYLRLTGDSGRPLRPSKLRGRLGRPCEVLAHVPDPLGDRDHRQAGEDPDRGLDQLHVEDARAAREDEPDGQDHDTNGPVGDADLALHGQ